MVYVISRCDTLLILNPFGHSSNSAIFARRMKAFKSYSWKVLGILLVLYSIFVGTTTKVGPGVVGISPSEVTINSDFEITVETYNTSYRELSNSAHAWLKIRDSLVLAKEVSVLAPQRLKLTFDGIPLQVDTTNVGSSTLVLEDEYHGMYLGVDVLRTRIVGDSSNTLTSIPAPEVRPQRLEQQFFSFPYRYILYETIRNLNFHVPMWFTMMTILMISFVYSIRYLNSEDKRFDVKANAFAKVGLMFGLMGIFTGMFWANYTWGTPWTSDPKLNGAAVAVLMYIAYQILRRSIDDEDKIARISAVYNVLAYPIFIVLIIVLPKMAEFSLHPGSGDSVGFNTYDLNNNLRMIFYPSVLGWILIGIWIGQLTSRVDLISFKRLWKDIEKPHLA